MSEMVERVARVLYLDDSGKDWDQQNSWVHEMYFKKARAVIEAMREPPEAMVAMGVAAYRQFDREYDSDEDMVLAVYQAGIDEALK